MIYLDFTKINKSLNNEELNDFFEKCEKINILISENTENNFAGMFNFDQELAGNIMTIMNIINNIKKNIEKIGEEKFYKESKNISIMNLLLTKYKILNLNFNLSEELEKIELSNKYLLDNFFTNKQEIIGINNHLIGKFGIYVLILSENNSIRIFNLMSHKNGFHIFNDGRFCAGNTYQVLEVFLNKNDLPGLLTILSNLLSDHDDKHHHLASISDFQDWINFYDVFILKNKKVSLSKSEEYKEKILKIGNKKLERILTILSNKDEKTGNIVSEEGLNFISNSFKNILYGLQELEI